MQKNETDVNSEFRTIDGVTVKTLDQLDTKNPQPGIYERIPFDVYRDLDALNSSKIRKALDSMLVYKRYLVELETIKPSYALDFGLAFAALCENPDALESKIKAGPTKGAHTIAWCEEMKENPETIYIKEDDFPMLKAMIHSFRNHQYTKQFSYDAFNELTVIWICEHTKQLCKCRIDIFKDFHVIDCKTTKDVRPRKFKWQIIDFRYDIQVCFYADGLRANKVRVNWCSNFFIEKEESMPDVVPKGYNQEQMDDCRDEYIGAIEKIIEAKKTGVYHGYAPEPLIDLYGFDEPSQTFE